jgi:hypothetical protein
MHVCFSLWEQARSHRETKQQEFHAITLAMQSGKHSQLFGKQAKGQKKTGP